MKLKKLKMFGIALLAAAAIMSCQINETKVNDSIGEIEDIQRAELSETKSLISPVYVYSGLNRTGQSQLLRTTLMNPNLANWRWPNGVTMDNTINSIYVPSTVFVIVSVDIGFRGTQKILHGGATHNLNNYGLANKISSLEIVLAPQAYQGATYLSNYPHARENNWAKDCQGLTNDGTNWYISSKTAIRKIHKSLDLNGSHDDKIIFRRPVSNNDECHIGDISYFNGEIYAPVEDCIGTYPNRIYVLDTNGKVKRWAYLPRQSHASWVTVNPENGWMYSSEFNSGVILMYNPQFTTGASLIPHFALRMVDGSGKAVSMQRIQGGVFGPRNILYLSIDSNGGGICMFRCLGGEARYAKKIGPNGYKPQSPYYEEIEGLTWWPLDGNSTVNSKIPGGNLHWILVDNDPRNEDDVYLKHLRIGWK